MSESSHPKEAPESPSGASPTPTAAESPSPESVPAGAPAKRGVSEWVVVLLLVALIVGVAWSQFGSLFEESTEGSPGGLSVEGPGLSLGGSAMSHLPTGDEPSPGSAAGSNDPDGATAMSPGPAHTPDQTPDEDER